MVFSTRYQSTAPDEVASPPRSIAILWETDMKLLSGHIAAVAIATCLAGSAGLAYAQTAAPPATPPAAPAAAATPGAHQWNGKADARAHHEQMVERLFAKLDPQKTGAITLEAYLKAADARFDKIETKKQGFIDHDELAAYVGTAHPQMADWIMKRLDTKQDGKITREEAELAGPLLHLLMPHMKHEGQRNGEWQHHRMQDHMNAQTPAAQ